MQAVRGLLVGFTLLLIGGPILADAKDDAKKALLGKWQTTGKKDGKEYTLTLTFEKDGKLSLKITGDPKAEVSGAGKYEVLDDKTLEVTVTVAGSTKTDKTTYKVTKDTLELSAKGNTEKFTRAK